MTIKLGPHLSRVLRSYELSANVKNMKEKALESDANIDCDHHEIFPEVCYELSVVSKIARNVASAGFEAMGTHQVMG